MARQVLPIVGAVITTIWGGNPQLGYAIGAMIGNAVDPQRIKGPRLREGPAQSYGEGAYRQVVFGTSWIWDCQVLEVGPIRRVTVEDQQGKGGGPVVESERGYQTFAIGLGEPLEAIRVLRIDGKIVYDVRPTSTILAESAEFAKRFRFYTGAEDQLPDPDLEALPGNGVGNTAYYRGTAYLVFPNYDVTDLAGRIPTVEAEGTNAGSSAYFTGLFTDRDFYLGPPDVLTAGQLNVFSGLSPVARSIDSSPSGDYLSFGLATSPYIGVFKKDQTTGVYSQILSGIGAISSPVGKTAWHPSGAYFAAVQFSANQITIYARSGDTFTIVETLAVGGPLDARWSPDGFKLAVSTGDALSSVRVYSFAAGSFGGFTTANSTLNLLGASALAWTKDSLHIAAGGNQAIEVFDASGGQVEHMDALSVSPSAHIGVAFSRNDGYIYTLGTLAAGNSLAVYTFNAAAIAASDALAFDNFPASQPSQNANRLSITPDGGFIAVAETDTQVKVYEANGTGDQLTLAASQPPISSGSMADVAWTGAPTLAIVSGAGIALSSLVQDICDRCGLGSAKLDLAELTDQVAGVTLGGQYDGAGAITTLMPAYFFDLFEADRKVHAVKRGGAVVQTITAADLIDEPDENTLRGQDIEYPRALLLKYLDPDQNYAAPAATVQRNSPDIRVRGEATAELPIAMTRTQAFQVAERMHKVMWEDLNGEVTFSLPAGPFAWLTPSDCLGLSLRGALYRVRAEKVEYAAGVLKVTARRDRQSAYTSALTPIPLPEPTAPPGGAPGQTVFRFLNLPAISGDDDRLGYRFAALGLSPGWFGVSLQRRSSFDTDYTTVAQRNQNSVIGMLLESVNGASAFGTDTTNAVRVALLDGAQQLDQLTLLQFLRGGGGFALVGGDGTGELLQYRDVTDEGGGIFSLSHLARGRGNTGASAHSPGETFVLLSSTQFVEAEFSLLGQTIVHRPVSSGTSPESSLTYTHTLDPAYCQVEMPVAFLKATRSAANVLTITWSERCRFGTSRNPVRSGKWKAYRVTLTKGATTVVLPDQIVTGASYDATALGAGVTVRVQQINNITGLGPASEVIV